MSGSKCQLSHYPRTKSNTDPFLQPHSWVLSTSGLRLQRETKSDTPSLFTWLERPQLQSRLQLRNPRLCLDHQYTECSNTLSRLFRRGKWKLGPRISWGQAKTSLDTSEKMFLTAAVTLFTQSNCTEELETLPSFPGMSLAKLDLEIFLDLGKFKLCVCLFREGWYKRT